MKGGVMARMTWHEVGARVFEVGVDRGVLFIGGEPGIPWNGLIAVTENPSGSEMIPYYADGIKYLNEAQNSEFAATVEAFTYPKEFDRCIGISRSIPNGLLATEQRLQSFGMSYRSLVGNDVDGVDHGYKIHLVYDAKAMLTERNYNTMSDTIEPLSFSWDVSTSPKVYAGEKPTAHFVIDSKSTPEILLGRIEEIIYGGVGKTPRLPSVEELVFLFDSYRSSIFDARMVGMPYYNTIDGGVIPEIQTSTIDANLNVVDGDYYDGGYIEDTLTEFIDGGSP
jgi:hypothetical protein